ncbi:MAG: uncharacterized protein QOD84_2624 [Acidobacteriaceae bacterium]|jgi:uncharacterized protein
MSSDSERARGLRVLYNRSRVKHKIQPRHSLLVLILLAASALRAEPISQLHPTNYVNDFAGVLNPDTISQLNNLCQQVDEKAHAQIAVATIKSLDGNDIDSYAVELYKKWGVGSKSTNRGVLILLATEDRRYRTEVGYGLEPILPDGKVGGFGREAVPLLKNNDYNGAIALMVSRVVDVIAKDAGVELTGARPELQERPQPRPSLATIIVYIIIALVVLLSPLRRLLFWGLLFSGGGGGYRGGGGFGGGGFGGGGGGGFGGFGGGSSGGGGASGSW